MKQILYCCGKCEWIFKSEFPSCPECGFACYTAYSVYGRNAYRFAKTQKPWLKKKIAQYHLINL